MNRAAAVSRISARGEPSFLLSLVLTMEDVAVLELLVEVRVDEEDLVEEDRVDVELAEPVTEEELAEVVLEDDEVVPEDDVVVVVIVPVLLTVVVPVAELELELLPVVVVVAEAVPA